MNSLHNMPLARQVLALGEALTRDVDALLRDWEAHDYMSRLWAKDATLWTGADEGNWLDWLDAVARGREALPQLNAVGKDLHQGDFTAALLIGMGGSSLGPEVMAKILGDQSGGLPLAIIDSTDPAQIATCEAALDIGRTLFIVASKSGSTLEPDILLQYFFAKAKAALGSAAGRHFLAITDPGSKLETYARDNGFRHVVSGVPTIGGRYSVLSNFGLVPAMVMGLDTERFLACAGIMVDNCSAATPAHENRGLALGLAMGAAARAGRDKLTVLASPALAPFGAWIEQLVAESTGKQGRGIVPVDAEPLGAPSMYGNDRLFVDLRLEGDSDPVREQSLAALAASGQPVVTISITSREQIAQEFFHWQMATAVAGAVLGIHPFDQPDVEAAKVQTRSLMAAYEREHRLPPDAPSLREGDLAVYWAAGMASVQDYLADLLRQIDPGDYFALLAYLDMNERHISLLQGMRTLVRDRCRVATCLGFGPRFLHSTGQLYKGGPNRGVFLQLTCDDIDDLPIPNRDYTFGTVKTAQALGDLSVLQQRGRRVLRIHLGTNPANGMLQLQHALQNALAAVANAA